MNAIARIKMDSSRQNPDSNVHCSGGRSRISGSGNIGRNCSNAVLRFLVHESMPRRRRHLSSTAWFVILTALWYGSLHALAYERIRNNVEQTVEQAAVVSIPPRHEDSSRHPAQKYGPTLCYHTADVNTQPEAVDDPVSAVAIAFLQGNDEPNVFPVTKRSDMHSVVLNTHTMSEQGTQRGTALLFPEEGQEHNMAGRRMRLMLEMQQRSCTYKGSVGCGPNSALHARYNIIMQDPLGISGTKDTYKDSDDYISSTLMPWVSSRVVSGATQIDTLSGEVPAARESAVECDSTLSFSRKSDRTRGVSSESHDAALAGGPLSYKEPLLDACYEYKAQQHRHDLSGQNLQLGPRTDSRNNSQRVYVPQARENHHPAEKLATNDNLNSLEDERFLPTASRNSHQTAHIPRSLAASEVYNYSLSGADIQKDAQQLAASATGDSETAEVDKEAMGLVSGVRGRNSGARQRYPGRAGPPIPGNFPYYYSTLTPQQIQMLAAQQHLQSHSGAQYQRQHQQLPGVPWESEAPQQHQQQQQQPQLLSPAQQLAQQYHQQQRAQEQQQYNLQRAAIPPPYYPPQQMINGAVGWPGAGRRSSRQGLTPRQQHRLQRQQRQLPQQHFPFGLTQNAAPYFGSVPFHDAALTTASFAPAVAATGYTPQPPNGAYNTGRSIASGSHMPSPQDPNLLPLQYTPQKTQGERLEAQLRNQHDAYAAREYGSR